MSAYLFSLLSTSLLVMTCGTYMLSRNGLHWARALFLTTAAVAAALVGGRMLHWMAHPALYLDGEFHLTSLHAGGLSLAGGMAAGTAVLAVGGIRWRLETLRLLDGFAPVAGMGVAVMRLGCFLQGCCHGIPTDAPWAVSLRGGAARHWQQVVSGFASPLSPSLPVHPTQLYESVAALACVVVAWRLARRPSHRAGTAFFAFTLLFALLRLAIYPLRADAPSSAAHMWIWVAIAGIGSFGLLMRLVSGRQSNEIWSPVLPPSTFSNPS